MNDLKIERETKLIQMNSLKNKKSTIFSRFRVKREEGWFQIKVNHQRNCKFNCLFSTN